MTVLTLGSTVNRRKPQILTLSVDFRDNQVLVTPFELKVTQTPSKLHQHVDTVSKDLHTVAILAYSHPRSPFLISKTAIVG